MTRINSIINNLITKVKEQDNLNNVCFLKAYNKDMAQKPIKGYIVVVDFKQLVQSQSFVGGYFSNDLKGEIYSAKVVLRVYTGRESSGKDLGDIALKISAALKEADKDSLITDIFIGPITYDSQFEAIFREITML